jgi:hypothetical protein
LLGLIILVQGFETSRNLGAHYDGPTRIATKRYAQLLSSGIYFLFILLITPLFRGRRLLQDTKRASSTCWRPQARPCVPSSSMPRWPRSCRPPWRI